MTSMTALFRPAEGEAWRPDPITRGPFDGMQGGVAAGLMCAEVEAVAGQGGLGFVSAFTAHFLKPTPVADLTVTISMLRQGRRVSFVDASLSGPAGLCAVARATLIQPMVDDQLPVPPDRPCDPAALSQLSRAAPHGGPWFMDAMEVRVGQGQAWFRQRQPLRQGQGPMTAVLPAADWSHGLGPPLGANTRPPVAIPNPDLTVHLFRPPVGEWIGLESASAWSHASIGGGWSPLYDIQGLIGQVAMSVAITRLVAHQTSWGA